MGSIYDVIKKLGESNAVGHKIVTKGVHDGKTREFTIESYSKRKKEATLSRKVGDKKMLLRLSFDSSGSDAGSIDEEELGYPTAVYTSSGKLVHLIV